MKFCLPSSLGSAGLFGLANVMHTYIAGGTSIEPHVFFKVFLPSAVVCHGGHTCHASHHRLPQNLQPFCGGHRLRVRRALGRTLVTVGLSLGFVSYEKKLRKIHTCGDQCSPSQRQARKFWVSNFSASTNTTLRCNPPGGGEFPGTGVVEV